MKLVDWRNFESLPSYEGSEWAIWRRGRVVRRTQEHVASLGDELLNSGVLIGRPGAVRFLPAICIEELQGKLLPRIQRRRRTTILVMTIFMVAGFVASIWAHSLLKIVLVFSLLPLVMELDNRFVLENKASLAERAMFAHWIHTDRRGLYIWSAIGIFAGLVQIFVQYKLGSLTAAFHAYGFMYGDVRAGQLWRAVTGPFLHYSLAHFVTNFFLLVLIGWLTWPIFGISSLFMLLAGNAASAFGQMYLGGQLFDNFGGLSGGIYSLFGLLAGAGIVDWRLCPRGFGIVFVVIALMSIAYSEVMSAHAATVGHLTGLTFGLLTGAGWASLRLLARRKTLSV